MSETAVSVALVLVTVAAVLLLDRSRRPGVQAVLQWFPAILFAYVIPALVTHAAGLELGDGSIHAWSRDWIMPLAVVLVMGALSARQLRAVGLRPVVVFAVGSATVALAPVALTLLAQAFAPATAALLVEGGYWRALVPVVGSWIGGSTSQLVLKEVVDCPEGIFLAVLVLDNVLVNVWTLVMFQAIRRSEALNAWLGLVARGSALTEPSEPPQHHAPAAALGSSEPPDVAPRVTATLAVCAASVLVVHALGLPFLGVVLALSALGLLYGNLLPWWHHAAVLRVGGVLIVVIMAILGLRLDFSHFSLPLPVVAFAVVWLLLHYAAMLAAAYGLKVHTAWVAIGSMANVGGISTAPAVTKAYREAWMPHAILLAVLSMVTGTLWGLLTIWLFRALVPGVG